jgi:phosphohistidine swiveling domain-containing protein
MESEVKRALDTIVSKALDDSSATAALLDQDVAAFARCAHADEELITLIEEFRREYFWIRNNYYRSGTLTFDEACAIVVDHCELLRKGTSQHVEGNLEVRLRESARRKMQQIARDDNGVAMLIDLWDRMAQFKDDRKRTNLLANHHLETLLREAARRRRVGLSDVRNLLPHEVAGFISGTPVKSLSDRRQGMVVLWRAGEDTLQCLYEPDLAALAFGGIGTQIEKAASRAEFGRTIAGIGNGYGTVEGVAYVCETYHDALRIPPGTNAILLTYMTSPEWLGIMSRVQGIVTVEGGQACHAFLSCSQMKKPLIIHAQGAVDPALHGATVRLDSNGGTLQVLQAAR